MGKEITRRQFLKEAVSTTATLSAGFCIGPSFDLKETVQCKNCGAVNVYTRSYLTDFKCRVCHDCGINLKTLKHDITCHGYPLCSEENTDDRDACHLPECCQIPFPNHKYLKLTRKPYFSIMDLKF